MTPETLTRHSHNNHMRLSEEFHSLSFARNQFPMLTEWGVRDFSTTIHSLGCNYLAALGRQLGCWAMTEYPVQMAGKSDNRVIRPDVVWWNRPGGEVTLLGEFERYEPGKEANLAEKVRHLVGVYHQLNGSPKVLLLLAWTMAGADLSVLSEIRRIGYEGYRTGTGIHVFGISKGCRLIVAAAIFVQSDKGHILQRIKE